MNAPSVFLIAKDLRNMQVWVAVNEADITLKTMHALYSSPKHEHTRAFLKLLSGAQLASNYHAAQVIIATIYKVCKMKMSKEFIECLTSEPSFRFFLVHYIKTVYDCLGHIEVKKMQDPPITQDNIMPFPGEYVGSQLEESECMLCLALQDLYSKNNVKK